MNRISSDELYYYDKEVVKKIKMKYNLPYMESFKKFVNSETYKMLENKKLALNSFSYLGIFDMWEAEQVTGNPRNSVYIRYD